MNGQHITTAQCAKGAERKRWRIAEEEMWESVDRAFKAYVRPIETVTSFIYLGRVLTAADDDWPAVVGNLRKGRKRWLRLERILGWEGAIPRVSGGCF